MSLKIGISAKFHKKSPSFYGETKGHIQYLETHIAQWIGQKGSLPLMIPSVSTKGVLNSEDLDPFAYASELDALILQGGTDIHPKFYGEEPEPSPYEFDEDRDVYELQLIEAFMKEGKPILGVCRGFQLLNVFFKGTLYQDLERNSFFGHLHVENGRKHHHQVEIVDGGLLAESYKEARIGSVISIHHQGVKKLGKDLIVEAVSKKDSLIEGFSYTGDNYVLGVQWHPEFHEGKEHQWLDASLILQGFYKAAKNRRYYGSSLPKKKKRVTFGESEGLSLGASLELQILDQGSLELKRIAPEILADLDSNSNFAKEDLQLSVIDVESNIRINAREIERDWNKEVWGLQKIAHSKNATLGGSGTHPFCLSSDRILNPSPKYLQLIEKNEWTAKRLTTFGLNIHVGMPSKDDAIRFYRHYMALSPLLLGLSANSPFWEGENTGLATARANILRSVPSGNHQPCLNNWQEFEGLFSKLMTARAIGSYKDLWWDIRPSIDNGTLEIRICDMLPTIRQNAAMVALVHLLGVTAQEEPADFKWPDLSEWSYAENKWRATRYGLNFKFIFRDNAETIPAKQYLQNLFEYIEPAAQTLGYLEYLGILKKMAIDGTNSEKQRRIFEENGNLQAVVKSYAAELNEELSLNL